MHTPLPESVGIFGAWSPDGRMVVLVRKSDILAVLDGRSGEIWGEWSHPNHLPNNCVNFSPDGRSLSVARPNGVIQLWDLAVLRRGLKACSLDFPLPDMEPASQEPRAVSLEIVLQ